MQLVCSIVCNFNGIAIFKFSPACINFKVSYLEEPKTLFNEMKSAVSFASLDRLGCYKPKNSKKLTLFCIVQNLEL